MNSYRARMAVGLLVPLAALAGCSSGSSSSKVTAGAMGSTKAGVTTKTNAMLPSHSSAAVTEGEQVDPWKVLLAPTQPVSGVREWAHVASGQATYSVVTGKKLSIRGTCEGSGVLTLRIGGGMNVIGVYCGDHLGDSSGSVLVGPLSKGESKVEITPGKGVKQWAVAVWSGATAP